MKFSVDSNVLTVFLEGRIDSSNAQANGDEIEKILNENPHESVILDADSLEYISSAGLRVILKTRKAEPTLKIVNASSEVYDIFEMTGFTEMIPVSKAYRKLSVEGCEVIGQGANGKVYRLDPDTIIKVYYNPDSLPDIHRERELARKAFVLGIPTAIPYDVVRVGNSYGSVFELLNAKSFAKLIKAEPENLDKYVELYVDLLKKIHSTELKDGEMPDMKAVALNWASFLKDYLPEDQFNKLYSLVEAVPKDNHMMHGDYHIKNVMMQNGEVLLIDMDTLCMGHPVFEMASVYLAYCGYSENDHSISESFMGIPHETAVEIWKKTLRLYFETDDEAKLKEYEDKAMVVGYTRMMRRTIRRNGFETELGRKDIETCKQHLAELLARVDTLEF
ncbi:MAG: anti-sigma factor antagonist [Clostridiales bacterium]|nr:anti-sigma factor antagonist [Candidatus Equinaster intestinalis]